MYKRQIEGIKALTNIKTYHIRVNSAETQMEDDFIYGMVTNTVSVGGFKTCLLYTSRCV